jgi:hypothetical protein
MRDKRGNWYLLTGLLIGLVLGVVLAIVVIPPRYINTDPRYLMDGDRMLYRSLVAQSYLAEADLGRAQARLNLLGDENPEDQLIAQAQQQLKDGGDEAESRTLALLAADIQQGKSRVTPLPGVRQGLLAFSTQTAAPQGNQMPTASATKEIPIPGATVTLRPTITPQPTQGAPFVLTEQKEICDPAHNGGLIEVYIFNRVDKPVPGVKIEISIPGGGVETFYTGLYPEISSGYANFLMTEGMTYNLRVGEAGQLVQNLSIPRCETEAGKAYSGSLQLTFKKPE